MFDWSTIEKRVRQFRGPSLQQVAFPLGGIGTGTVSLGGRGNLRDWEVFNRPAKGHHLPYTFFAIRADREGAPCVARVLERRFLPPYEAGGGLSTGLVSGLPRLEEAAFTGAYPIARIVFTDADLPVEVTLEAFNPFIPMNDRDSGLPCAVFNWTVRNPGQAPVTVDICFSVLNACGLDGTSVPGNRRHPQLGSNLNRWMDDEAIRGIAMSSSKYDDAHPQAGTMAIATPAENATYLTRWERAGWWDDVQSFWDLFRAAGRLPNGPDPEPSPDGESDVASVSVRKVLEPGSSANIPFLLAWRFPNLQNTWNAEEAVRGARLGNWYATQWPSAWDAAAYAARELPRLVKQTQAYCDALFGSTLPDAALDAASANVSTMRTTTCIRTEDGRFHGFEGCSDNSGCCPMNCTHVWNYEQAVAFLFPALERTMRVTDFAHNTRETGNMSFRTLLPLRGHLWDFKPAADGQMGTIMKIYREWLQCGDRDFLARLWPNVVRALEFAWLPGGWDADKDGVMEGEQHNTYDIEFHGPNTMMGTLYLGALRAAEEMARALGDEERAADYRAVFESGWRKTIELLWNGSYFNQIVLKPGSPLDSGELDVASPDYPRYQHGRGCLSDQLLGQWFARVVGLGDLLPADSVAATLSAIHANNFRSDLSTHHSVQRVYALNDEAGLLLCTWPNGGRPAYPFPYADEVWTGIEYQVAAHMIYEGLIEQGMQIVSGVRSRHDGLKRNPWNEPECGHHYARAMSSWSLILAFSGYHYDAGKRLLRFAPRTDADPFRCFFSAGNAWGTVELQRASAPPVVRLTVAWGSLELERLTVSGLSAGSLQAAVDGSLVTAEIRQDGVVFGEAIRISEGQTLTIE
jgi:uncharacterized protein (DUF608 family)